MSVFRAAGVFPAFWPLGTVDLQQMVVAIIGNQTILRNPKTKGKLFSLVLCLSYILVIDSEVINFMYGCI